MKQPLGKWIDTHCHPNLFAENWQEVYKRSQAAGVDRWIAVATCPEDTALHQDAAKLLEGKLYYSLGLHPCQVQKNWREKLAKLRDQASDHPAFVAIGETGLDGSQVAGAENSSVDAWLSHADLSHQIEAFQAHLEWAKETDKALIVHSRAAFTPCLDMVKTAKMGPRTIFHCFCAGPPQMEKLLAANCRASFTGMVTWRKSHLIRQAMRLQGLKSLMLETDAPYLSPEPLRSKNCEPAYLTHTAQVVAELFKIDLPTLGIHTNHAAESFFQLPN